MFKTIFIILVSVTASAITTAALLYRYTVPVEQGRSDAVVSAPVQTETNTPVPGPVEILDEYVSIQTQRPPVNTALPEQPAVAKQPAAPSPVTTAAPKRAFDHELLMSDISAVSKKLESFNDFLSDELQRLKGSSKENQP